MADQLARLLEVMDRLRSPGGCPWDAQQDHRSLMPYALEEVHELADAVETGDRAHLVEELGDVLLQVVFHARIGQEHPTDPFSIEDVARVCADKLVERHPHVFGDVDLESDEQLHRQWHAIKAATQQRESVMDGIPPTLGALARAQKVLARAHQADCPVPAASSEVGQQLLALVEQARVDGVDAEQELRAALREVEAHVRAHEAARASSQS